MRERVECPDYQLPVTQLTDFKTKQERKLTSASRSRYTLAVIIIKFKTRKNAIVEYLDYQIPVTQLKGPKGNADMQAAKRY